MSNQSDGDPLEQLFIWLFIIALILSLLVNLFVIIVIIFIGFKGLSWITSRVGCLRTLLVLGIAAGILARSSGIDYSPIFRAARLDPDGIVDTFERVREGIEELYDNIIYGIPPQPTSQPSTTQSNPHPLQIIPNTLKSILFETDLDAAEALQLSLDRIAESIGLNAAQMARTTAVGLPLSWNSFVQDTATCIQGGRESFFEVLDCRIATLGGVAAVGSTIAVIAFFAPQVLPAVVVAHASAIGTIGSLSGIAAFGVKLFRKIFGN